MPASARASEAVSTKAATVMVRTAAVKRTERMLCIFVTFLSRHVVAGGTACKRPFDLAQGKKGGHNRSYDKSNRSSSRAAPPFRA
ncbi:hypothetical protein EFR01_19970 [Sinorhizobium fredii]|nr:hypothetical protein EFR01_19970 [Sinorhizobium fredii]GLS12264.1 hypothetical protein GCM10007864_58960 [Sinorhizobium fredii]